MIPKHLIPEKNIVCALGTACLSILAAHMLMAAGVDISAGFHVYGCECIFGESITVYFDGRQVYQAKASSSQPIAAKPYSILLDTQVMIPVGQNPNYNPKGWHAASSAFTPSPMSWEVAEVQVCVP